MHYSDSFTLGGETEAKHNRTAIIYRFFFFKYIRSHKNMNGNKLLNKCATWKNNKKKE